MLLLIKLDENLGNRGQELLKQDGHDVSTVAQQSLEGTGDEALIEVCRVEPLFGDSRSGFLESYSVPAKQIRWNCGCPNVPKSELRRNARLPEDIFQCRAQPQIFTWKALDREQEPSPGIYSLRKVSM